MNSSLITKLIVILRICIAATIITILSLLLFSFVPSGAKEELFVKLGLTRDKCNNHIATVFLGRNLDCNDARHIKSISQGNRTVTVKEICAYTKAYTGSQVFRNRYYMLRESNRPALQPLESPAEFRQILINHAREAIQQTESDIKNTDAQLNRVYSNRLLILRQQLAFAEDSGNVTVMTYTRNYMKLKESYQATYDNRMNNWNASYPCNCTQFIKARLRVFLQETEQVDYDAPTIEHNGVKYFRNPCYENKGKLWKMAFRAGKGPVETARAFVQLWMREIQ